MLMVFSNAFLILVGACWMASVNCSSCSSVSSSTTICSNSCSAWVSVMAARTSGLDAIWVAWSDVMSADRTWVMAATICSGAASVMVSRICSSCLSVTGSFAGILMTVSGRVVGDEFSADTSVVFGVYSCGCVVFVGCSVSSGAGSTSGAGTVVSGMVVWSGSTGSLSCSAGSSTGPGR